MSPVAPTRPPSCDYGKHIPSSLVPPAPPFESSRRHPAGQGGGGGEAPRLGGPAALEGRGPPAGPRARGPARGPGASRLPLVRAMEQTRNPRPGDLKGRREERGPVLEPPSPETEKSNNRSIFLSRGTRGTARTATSLPPTTPPRQASSHALEPSSGPDGLISPNSEISPSGLRREERSIDRIRRDFPLKTSAPAADFLVVFLYFHGFRTRQNALRMGLAN